MKIYSRFTVKHMNVLVSNHRSIDCLLNSCSDQQQRKYPSSVLSIDPPYNPLNMKTVPVTDRYIFVHWSAPDSNNFIKKYLSFSSKIESHRMVVNWSVWNAFHLHPVIIRISIIASMHTYELIITSLPPIQTLEADLVQQGAHLGRDASSQHGHLSWLTVIYWAGSYLHTYYRTQFFSSHENEFAFLGEVKTKRNDIFDKLNIKKYLDPLSTFLLLVHILQIPWFNVHP